MLTDLSRPGLPAAPAVLHLVDTAQMRRIEQVADAHGHSYAFMMARAGAAVAAAVATAVRPGSSVLVLVGPGNNGGDGLVAALDLARSGCAVKLAVWQRAADDGLLQQAKATGLDSVRCDGSSLPVVVEWLGRTDAVVDALLGTGVSRPLGADVAGLLDAVQSEAKRRLATAPSDADASDDGNGLLLVAVDVPTGLNADTGSSDPHTLSVDLTVTFGRPKLGQFLFPGAGHCGRLLLDDIGIRPAWIEAALASGSTAAAAPTRPSPRREAPPVTLATRAAAKELLPPRPRGGHKGTFGRALVVAGSARYTGAAFLAGLAAYRAGAGLVTLALPESIHPIAAGLLPEATFLLLPEVGGAIGPRAAPRVAAAWADYDAVLVGPGLGTSPATRDFLAALTTSPPPRRLIVDADGLNLLAQLESDLHILPPETVLTPHPGEMGRLIGKSASDVNADRVDVARDAATSWGHIVLLKGPYSLVATPDGRLSMNPFATPLLATAGSGDVLSGAILGLLAQGAPPRQAAILGAYLHAMAALGHPEAAAGGGLLAREIADGLPRSILALSQSPD